MTEKRKAIIMEQVSLALDKVSYGKVVVELRGPAKSVDVVVENRVRVASDLVDINKSSKMG